MQSDPWLGQPLADGRYVVGEKLGEGGMGRVFLAQDIKLDIPVVVKSPHPVLLSESEFKQRFSREVRTLLQLQHPHIIRVLDFAEHEGVPFAVLEYLPSGSLADQIATSNGVRPVESLARWLPHAAEALDYLHERGIVHRDIKPANLFFDENGHVRLGDFGIVKSLRSDKTKTSALTGTGMALGTPEYMAPELALGEDYDGRVDQYALAVTVYEALCGSVPFIGTTSAAVVVAQLSRLPEPLTDRNELVSETLSAVVLKAMSRTANKRFASCGEFAAAVLDAPPRRLQSAVVAVASIQASAPAMSSPMTRKVASPPQPIVKEDVACPACGGRLRITANLAGCKLRCKTCDAKLRLSADGTCLEFRTSGETSSSHTHLPTMMVPVPEPEPIAEDFMTALAKVQSEVARPPQPPQLQAVDWKVLLREYKYWIGVLAVAALIAFVVSWRDRSKPLPIPEPAAVAPTQPQSSQPSPEPAPTLSPSVPKSQFADGTTAGERKVVVIEGIQFAFHWCPPGSFKMGSPASEKDRTPDEAQVNVTLTQGFWMLETEVTQAMWTAVMTTKPWQGQQYVRDGANYPATLVSWDDSTAFCTKLTEIARREGVLLADQRLSLPSEAEWEYACRAGTKTAYSFGDDPNQLSTYAWWGGLAGDGNAKTEPYAHQVGTKTPNLWGLSDMHGNVWEWCSDSSAEKLGRGPRGPSGALYRGVRGGSWYDISDSCRSAHRDNLMPDYQGNNVGFRVIRGSAPPTLRSELPDDMKAGDKRIVRIDNVEYPFRWCPPGQFRMGSPVSEKNRQPNEDQVGVTLTQGFWMLETEVTQAMWMAVMSTKPWQGQQYVRDGANYPATLVSWDDATAFCARLTDTARREGVLLADQRLSLPSEAEWEYACRAGTTTAYSFGNDASQLSNYAWWGELFGNGNAKTEKYAHEVGTRLSNQWGLSDMHGNVWELCRDWYAEKLPSGSDPRGPSVGTNRTLRGGGWRHSPEYCRSAARHGNSSGYRFFDAGFRVACLADATPTSPPSPELVRTQPQVPAAGDQVILKTSEQGGHPWRYKTSTPPANWTTASPTTWSIGLSGFGSKDAPGLVVRTRWSTSDIWLRTKITMPELQGRRVFLRHIQDDIADVYVNGKLLVKFDSALGGFSELALNQQQLELFRVGENELAVYCHQQMATKTIGLGPQSIDIGFRVAAVPTAEKPTDGTKAVALAPLLPSSEPVAALPQTPVPASPPSMSKSHLPDGTTAGQQKVVRIDNIEYAFRWCPPGSFKMGSRITEKNRDNDESQVDVMLTKGFWMLETEVTQSMWANVMKTSPWKGQQSAQEGPTYPATYVSWDDSKIFCVKLTEIARQDGVLPADQSLNLPTEAQWEYACRAGTETAYSFGDDPSQLSIYAWFSGNTQSGKYAHQVGMKTSNPWRLSDMHGNVWEWCVDVYEKKLPRGVDPQGTWGSDRVLRGGSWYRSLVHCRSAFRYWNTPDYRGNDLGFRVLRSSVK